MVEITTFLLAEDDANDVLLVEREFRRAPVHLQLRVVRDGMEAKQYLVGEGAYADRRAFPLPDVILLDLKMPRWNGFEFVEWLRNEAPKHLRVIPVVVMSSSNLSEDVARAYALGANSYLVKPVSWTEFRERIRTLGVYWAEHVETPAVEPAAGASPNPVAR
jgi:CheY-like chemotaxis protein